MATEFETLRNAIVSLTNAILMSRSGVSGPSGPVPPTSFGLPAHGERLDIAGWKEYQEEMKKFAGKASDAGKALGDVAKGSRQTLDTLARFSEIMTPLTLSMREFAKYGVYRPAELMGGTAGQAFRGGLERTTAIGNIGFATAGGIAAIIASALGFGHIGLGIGAGITALGMAGGGALLTQAIRPFKEAGAEAGARDIITSLTQGKVQGIEPTAVWYARMGRTTAFSKNAGMTGFDAVQQNMRFSDLLGVSPQDAAEFWANTIKVGGVKGFRAIQQAGGADAISALVKEGIAGSDIHSIGMSISQAGRAGFSPALLDRLSRQAGLTYEQIAPSLMAVRAQTFMFGEEAHTRFAERIGRTEMFQFNPQFAVAGISGISTGMQAATGGGGAIEMMQFQMYRQANPDASFIDFITSKRNGANDPTGRWQKFMALAAASGAAGGQLGGLMFSAMGGGAPATAPRAALELGRFAGTLSAAPALATGRAKSENEAALEMIGQAQTRGAYGTGIDQLLKFHADYNKTVAETSKEMEIASKNAKLFRDAAINVNETIRDMTMGIVDTLKMAIGAWAEGDAYRPTPPGTRQGGAVKK